MTLKQNTLLCTSMRIKLFVTRRCPTSYHNNNKYDPHDLVAK